MAVPNYFLVVGRMHGDDEASAFVVEATDRPDAVEAFHRTIIELNDGDYNVDWATIPEDGPGAVYIDHIFDCGNTRPKEC